MQEIMEEAKKLQTQMVKDRRTIHKNPEVGLELEKTCTYVMKRLEDMGITPVRIGKGGVTATVGKGRRTILLRADMDALPTRENNDEEYASSNENGHLCGHDMHTAMLLGAAEILKKKENMLPGVVKFMFQPGEEIGQGAKDMIDNGILTNPVVDAAMALHVDAFTPAGHAGYKEGFMTSSLDAFFIEIQGKGGHGSTPELCVNPLEAAAYIEMMLSSFVQREIGAFEPTVLSIGKAGGGDVANVIPDTAVVQAVSRCYNSETREFIAKRVEEISTNVCKALRATCKVEHTGCPSVYSEPKMVSTVKVVLDAILGERNVEALEKPFTGSEDFSYISEQVPTVFFWLGAGVKDNYPLHNPNVKFDEDALWRGAAIYAASAISYLNEQSRL